MLQYHFSFSIRSRDVDEVPQHRWDKSRLVPAPPRSKMTNLSLTPFVSTGQLTRQNIASVIRGVRGPSLDRVPLHSNLGQVGKLFTPMHPSSNSIVRGVNKRPALCAHPIGLFVVSQSKLVSVCGQLKRRSMPPSGLRSSWRTLLLYRPSPDRNCSNSPMSN